MFIFSLALRGSWSHGDIMQSNTKEKPQKRTSELLGHRAHGHLLEQAYCDCVRHLTFSRSQCTLTPNVLVISLRLTFLVWFYFGIQNKVNCKSTLVDAAECDSRTRIQKNRHGEFPHERSVSYTNLRVVVLKVIGRHHLLHLKNFFQIFHFQFQRNIKSHKVKVCPHTSLWLQVWEHSWPLDTRYSSHTTIYQHHL